jgi:hypothetical protein
VTDGSVKEGSTERIRNARKFCESVSGVFCKW